MPTLDVGPDLGVDDIQMRDDNEVLGDDDMDDDESVGLLTLQAGSL